uniref:fermitin family homolog 3-like n=1 Tax=Agelaius phoeniceus TaxID=39638 RepID=UPI0023ED8529|nr:fermitin family homolog 3-like [Agelaius phoeniceus]
MPPNSPAGSAASRRPRGGGPHHLGGGPHYWQGGPHHPRRCGAQIRGVLGVLGVQPDGGDPPGTPARAPPDPRLLLPPRLQRRIKGKEFPQLLLRVLLREGPLSPPQARLRFLQAWRALPDFGLGVFIVRFQGAPRDEALAVGLSRLLRLPLGSGGAARSWSQRELRQWDVNWDSGQVRLWLSGDVTLGLRVLSAPPRVLHQFLGGGPGPGGAPPRPPRAAAAPGGGAGPLRPPRGWHPTFVTVSVPELSPPTPPTHTKTQQHPVLGV